MSRISLCLIAKDEERMLPGLLASVAGVVHETVLVDTGSTDGTVALARAAGAKVLHRPWDDDFAAPRNLAAASATGDWLLVMDADERLAPGAGPALRRAVRKPEFEVGMLRLHNATRADAAAGDVVSGAARRGLPLLVPRLIRNTGDVVWRGAIHESVGEWLIARKGRRRDVDVDLVHYGYAPEVWASRRKRERNVALLEKRWAEEPDDVTAAGYLALELVAMDELGRAADVVERAWPLVPRQPPARCVLRICVARAIVSLRCWEVPAALEAIDACERRSGPHPDLHYLRGFAEELRAARLPPGQERARALAAAEASQRAALAALGSGRAWELQCTPAEKPMLHLGTALLLQGRAGDALRAFAEALRAEPASASARVGAAEALLELGDFARALSTVEPVLAAGSPDGWLIAACAAERLHATADARTFLAKARALSGRGYECVHRHGRLRRLEEALSAA